MTRRIAMAALLPALLLATRGNADEPKPATRKTEQFNADPKWDALNNRVVPDRVNTVVQDFGFRAASGDVGGRVTRASKAAYYAAKIEPKTLNDKLSASGTFELE